MANSLPFNSVNKDRAIKAEDWAWYFATFIGNGVFPKPETGLQVQVSSAMNIKVAAGYGFINGYAFRNVQDYNLTIETADGTLGRYDRVILRWDLAAREVYIAVLKGNASANPQPTAIKRTTEIYDLVLADVYIAKGVTSIATADITDRRFNTDLCGIVKGVVDQIDASVITAQFDNFFTSYKAQVLTEYSNYLSSIATKEQAADTALNEFTSSLTTFEEEAESDFTAWVQSIKSILDDAVAGNLQNEIEALQTKTDELEAELLERTSITSEAWLGCGYLGGTYLAN